MDIPFIVVSGAVGEETAVEAMKAGAHDYVLKQNLDPAQRRRGPRAARRPRSSRAPPGAGGTTSAGPANGDPGAASRSLAATLNFDDILNRSVGVPLPRPPIGACWSSPTNRNS